MPKAPRVHQFPSFGRIRLSKARPMAASPRVPDPPVSIKHSSILMLHSSRSCHLRRQTCHLIADRPYAWNTACRARRLTGPQQLTETQLRAAPCSPIFARFPIRRCLFRAYGHLRLYPHFSSWQMGICVPRAALSAPKPAISACRATLHRLWTEVSPPTPAPV